ncbi:MAG: hypothetical protein R3324_02990, partial [Halobacteriales archaeon]|nr:hypothetical protein [Halobacteriales archaeon]
SDSDDEMPTTIRFWLDEATVSEQKRDDINPITCGNVTDGEKELIQTTIESGEYTSEIGSESPALDTLRERIGDQNPGGVEVYLRCDDTYYRVGFVDGDHIMANPDH